MLSKPLQADFMAFDCCVAIFCIGVLPQSAALQHGSARMTPFCSEGPDLSYGLFLLAAESLHEVRSLQDIQKAKSSGLDASGSVTLVNGDVTSGVE